jgi:hypothetical protein
MNHMWILKNSKDIWITWKTNITWVTSPVVTWLEDVLTGSMLCTCLTFSPRFFLTRVVVQVPWLPEVTECHVTPFGPPPSSSSSFFYKCIYIVFQNWDESSWNNCLLETMQVGIKFAFSFICIRNRKLRNIRPMGPFDRKWHYETSPRSDLMSCEVFGVPVGVRNLDRK